MSCHFPSSIIFHPFWCTNYSRHFPEELKIFLSCALIYNGIYSLLEEPEWRSGYSHQLRAGRSGVRIQAGATTFSLLRNVQTGSGAHSSSYSIGTGVFAPGVKRPGS